MMLKEYVVGLLAAGLWGCNLIDTKGVMLEYSLDAEHFASPHFGDASNPQTVPAIQCTKGAQPDTCVAAQAMLPADSNLRLACGDKGTCVAVAELRRSEKVDFSQQSAFPKDAVNGIDAVELHRVAYWLMTNTLNVGTSSVDVYVAPQAAMDEADPKAVRLGGLAPVRARSTVCGDPQDLQGDPMAAPSAVCDLPVTAAGRAALVAFCKDYKTPFQVIAHSLMTAQAGEPLPTGMVDFYVRPTVGLTIFK
jgi:hypothetical protein